MILLPHTTHTTNSDASIPTPTPPPPTRCVTMHAAVPVTRPLQNHLPLVRHLTTQAGLWMPQ